MNDGYLLGYILVIVAGIFALFTQMKVHGAYEKYAKVENNTRMTGAQIAKSILKNKNCDDVSVQMSNGGKLSDHYDPKNQTVNLSPDVYTDDSLASAAIAAHECGHAIQYNENYSYIVLRGKILPAAVIAGNISWVVIVAGAALGYLGLFYFGIILISVVLLFQILTLPIEYDASKRAMTILVENGYVQSDQKKEAKKVLDAAALTYVAATVSSLATILRLLLMTRRRD